MAAPSWVTWAFHNSLPQSYTCLNENPEIVGDSRLFCTSKLLEMLCSYSKVSKIALENYTHLNLYD